jgi:alpha-tubulin suppressor-like RCC1 family protein
MAWCGPSTTVVNVSRGAEGRTSVMCFGKNEGIAGFATHERLLRTPRPLQHPFPHFDAVEVAFGNDHMALVTACGLLFTGGSNCYGQLGLGADSSGGVSCNLSRVGLQFADRGPLLAPQPVLVEGVACGDLHTLAVIRSGGLSTVWGCGNNYHNQLATEQQFFYKEFTEVDISRLQRFQSRPGRVRVAAGYRFSVVATGDVVGTAGEDHVRLGLGAQTYRTELNVLGVQPCFGRDIKHLVAGAQHTLVACVNAGRFELYGWGSNVYWQLGHPLRDSAIEEPTAIDFDFGQHPTDAFSSMLAAGEHRSLVMVDGRVWSMGMKSKFCCERTLTPMDQTAFGGAKIASVSTGRLHSSFVTAGGDLFMYGSQSEGNNCIPTETRMIKSGVRGICKCHFLSEPTSVPLELFGDRPIGTWFLPPLYKLAVAMGTHRRLGWSAGRRDAATGKHAQECAACVFFDLDSLLIKTILQAVDSLMEAA